MKTILVIGIFVSVAYGNDCPWELETSKNAKLVNGVGIELNLFCPSDVNNRDNVDRAIKLKTFYETTISLLAVNIDLLSKLKAKDFIRSIDLSHFSFRVAEYNEMTRNLHIGSFVNDPNSDSSLSDIINVFRQLNDLWDGEFNGLSIIPENLSYRMDRKRDMAGFLPEIMQSKTNILIILQNFSNYKHLINTVQLMQKNEPHAFNSGVFYTDGNISNASRSLTSRMLKVFSGLPTNILNSLSLDIVGGPFAGFSDQIKYIQKLEPALTQISLHWNEISSLIPGKIRKIEFYFSFDSTVGDSSFEYNPREKSVVFPVGIRETMFKQEEFEKSLVKLMTL